MKLPLSDIAPTTLGLYEFRVKTHLHLSFLEGIWDTQIMYHAL